jgi:GxxExxY protein
MNIYPELTRTILNAAIEVHRTLGPGLLETVYEECLSYELCKRGLDHRRQLPLPIIYKGAELESTFKLDLLVEDKVILELKAVENILPVHEAQLLSYLKMSTKRVGLLINFNVRYLKHGIVRRVL